MMLWLLIGVMTAAAILAVLVPLSRRADGAGASDVDVYRDQLEEVERDRARGTIASEEAEAAKLEISRRLIAASDRAVAISGAPGPSRETRRRRMAALAGLVAVPAIAIAAYAVLGRPDLPDQPLQARLDTGAEEQAQVQNLVAQVEAELKRNPEDGRGWDVIAPVYLRTGRPVEATEAFRNAIRLQGSSAARQAGLGEALTLAAQGRVTDEARVAFDAALAVDARQPRARFYLGQAAEQAGDFARAAEIYRTLLADAPPDAPWRGLTRQALASAAFGRDGAMPEADPSALANLTPDERFATIRGMATGLEERLKLAPGDVGGHLRLIRAWTVLGDRNRARAAADTGRAALADDPAAVRRIDDLVLALGLEEAQPA